MVELVQAVKQEALVVQVVVETLVEALQELETQQFKVLRVVLDILEQTLIAVAVAVVVLQRLERQVLLDQAAKVEMVYLQA